MITKRTKMSLVLFLLVGVTCAALWLSRGRPVQGRAPSVAKAGQMEDPLAGLNQRARASRGADANAVRDLTEGVFSTLAPSDIPLFARESMTERVERAELSYRQGADKGITEDKVANTINELADKLGLPDYARVGVAMVRTTRVSLMIQLPHLIAQDAPGDTRQTKKVGSSINPSMSPLEATAVTLFLLQQKRLNEDFQLPQREFYANIQKKQIQRWQQWRAQKDGSSKTIVDQTGPTMSARSNAKTEEITLAIQKAAAGMSPDALLNLADSSLDTLGIKR